MSKLGDNLYGMIKWNGAAARDAVYDKATTITDKKAHQNLTTGFWEKGQDVLWGGLISSVRRELSARKKSLTAQKLGH